MIYEVRNQHDRCPYVYGLKDEIVHAYQSDLTKVVFGTTEIDIKGSEAKDGKTVIRVHIYDI